ncbi:NAD metabolism hydrolase of HD superfamily [Fructobacillus pseudoficulneus]|uniref:bis(5'-nucleosyl)-tetraphosphatase (symmetrical) n=1 Tax=Fructobacillus pseudoficulneus TaxID=220714 RepID=A0A3F3GUE6_9LACO|nr:bis(5'-nucleosyl)-tetraphosphatase (symmetrical) YqeK [Fructobacillus pseudoficulneus]GAP02985.1 NAD metabolism hydrolase of HD superfamily [Fructobacillus pseudoficulneus]SEH44686.1 putative HD superfamily hydrolase of NAD metabolism [Fructobacillus pseudoficulneus]
MTTFAEELKTIEEKVKAHLSDGRFQHCLRVKDYAIKLAKENHLDEEQAALAGLVHDYAKERPAEDFLKVIDQFDLDPDLKNWNRSIWHGVVGAVMIREELGINDPAILDAVVNHTTGDGVAMSPLAKVVFMADYLETGRTFPGVEEARKITDQSLDAGVFYQLKHTLAFLADQGNPIYPKTVASYNEWARHFSSK